MGQGQSSPSISTVSNSTADDGIAWWCKIGARGACVAGGLGAMVTGLFSCITVTPLCLVAGVLLILIGFSVVMLEAPCCCQFMDFIQPVSRFSERRTPFQKALIYGLPALVPLMLCFSVTTALGCALLFASGGVYGIIALGKKAERDVMMSRARGDDLEMKETLMANEESASVQ
ncbi:calcium channel flower homolog [Pomacea canaliculata]|uniref:calcium channel flower homolog n=1 Tax=Pomacea canaliculata TaxID=400727 RepID=UPI000D728914|nr:calcium channel flower homolog [Pomacea canaliculata]